jgi:hypothetical protein
MNEDACRRKLIQLITTSNLPSVKTRQLATTHALSKTSATSNNTEEHQVLSNLEEYKTLLTTSRTALE